MPVVTSTWLSMPVGRQGEHNVDGPGLGNGCNSVGIIGLQQVADIDQAQTETPGKGGADAGEFELQTRRLDQAVVVFQCSFVLAHQCFLGVDLLAGNGILLQQLAVALQVEASIGPLCLIASLLAECLVELGLERAGIELGERRCASAGRPPAPGRGQYCGR